MRDAGFGIGDSGCGIRDWGLGIGDWGFGKLDSGLGIGDSGFRIGNSGADLLALLRKDRVLIQETLHTTRWITTLSISLKVNLPHAINFRVKCAANLVTLPPPHSPFGSQTKTKTASKKRPRRCQKSTSCQLSVLKVNIVTTLP
jgi:hypothetical protein